MIAPRSRAACSVLTVAASLVIAAWSSPSLAEGPAKPAARDTHPSAPIVVVIGHLPPGVDEADLRARLSRELGAPVISAATSGQAARGTLHLDLDDQQATARFEASDGTFTQRSVAVPTGRDRVTTTLIVLSGNVARDEAAVLRAQILRRGARPEARASAEMAIAPEPEEAPEPPEPPDAPEPPEPPTPPVPPAIPAEPRGVTHIVCRPAPDQSAFFAGADFVPMLGTSLFRDDAVLGASLNIVGGLSGGVRGLQIGSVFNVVRGSVCGLQIGGAVNVTRDVAGVQIGGAVNVTRDVAGLQIGGAVNVARDVRGLQIGGAVNATRALSGLQIGGAVNVTDRLAGVQIGGGANIASRVRGFQLGAIDLAGDVSGAQIGAVNVAGRVRGVQIGAVNIAEDSDFSLGVLSIVRRGRSHLDVWGAETGMLTAAFKHGGRYFHNFYGVGIRPFDGDPRVAFTLGVGGHIPLGSRFFLDVDALANSLHRTRDFNATPAFLASMRSVVGLRVASGFALTLGPSYNVSFGGTDEAANLSLLGSSLLASGGSLFVRGWPGFSAGLSAF